MGFARTTKGEKEEMNARFTATLRRVGGNTKGTKKKDALGLTVPCIVCEDLKLKKGDILKVEILEK